VDLFDEVLDFIRKPQPERFDDLALRVFAYQFEHIAAYRDFCVHRGLTPVSVRGVNEVPAVSTAAFKYLVLGDPHARRVFITSGTTHGRDTRGRHFVPRLELYRASALAHLRAMLFSDGQRPAMLSLHPSTAVLPHSSLAQMIDWLMAEFGSGPGTYCANERAVDLEAAIRFLRAAQQSGQVVCLLGTTAAFAALFKLLAARDEPIRLAAGSRLMDTGGAKGQVVALSAAEVVALAETYLSIAPQMVVNEYGMTELCSQLYDATTLNSPSAPTFETRGKLAPPWMRVVARDPCTLAALPARQAGLLSFFDLANLGSISALLTEDLGTVREDGSVVVHGRAYAAQPRGCALAIEEFLFVPSDRALPSASASPRFAPPPRAGEIVATARRMKELPAVDSRAMARALADLFSRWRQPDYPLRRHALDATCELSGINRDLLDASLDALLRNFTSDQLLALADRCSPTHAVVGFIMPGNVTGAGLHEVVQTLIGGACPLIKPAGADPYFFPALADSLRTLDSRLGARLAVLNWSRAEQEATRALTGACELVVGFGDNSTIAQLGALMGDKLVDFGARMSIALIAREAALDDELAQALARDTTFFEQRGCLSLQQVFVEGADSRQVRELAQKIAQALEQLAQRWPPGRSDLGDTASARAVSEETYWRMAGGHDVRVWSGRKLEFSVICDPGAELLASPLCRTLRIATAPDLDRLRGRLSPGELSIEGVALADPAHRLVALEPHLRRLGTSYFCPPGQLQSPPPSWPHGGGRLLSRLLQS